MNRVTYPNQVILSEAESYLRKLTRWSLTYQVRLGAGAAGGALHSAINGPPRSRPALSTVTIGTPSGTTVRNEQAIGRTSVIKHKAIFIAIAL